MRIERSNETGQYVIKRLFDARNYAYICSPYISEQYAQEIAKLAKKCRSVKVLTSDKIIEKGFYVRNYFQAIKEKDGLNNLNFLVVGHRGHSFDHSKLYVVDDEYAVSGSANLTRPGMWQNNETVHISETPKDVQDIKEIFISAWEGARTSIYGESKSWNSKPNRFTAYSTKPNIQNARPNFSHSKDSILDAIMKKIGRWSARV